MGHLVLNVKNMVVNVLADRMLLGDAVKPVAPDFMVSLTADHVTVLQLRFVRLTQVRSRFKVFTAMLLKMSVSWGTISFIHSIGMCRM
jgi:hypothetical protein